MTGNRWQREIQQELQSFMAAHRRISTDLLARQTAQGALIGELFHVLAMCLPVAGRTSLLTELYALADKWKAADQAAPGALTDAQERIDAAEWARLTAETIAKMADDLTARLRPV